MLSPGISPVLPRQERNIRVSMPNRCFSINIKQVPLVPAISITCYKSQGLTLNKMILGPMRHLTRTLPQKATFYVTVTRVRSMKDTSADGVANTRAIDFLFPVNPFCLKSLV